MACKDGHVEIVRILLEHYADIEAGDLVSFKSCARKQLCIGIQSANLYCLVSASCTINLPSHLKLP